MKHILLVSSLATASTPFLPPAFGQESRAEELAQEQSAKSTNLKPYAPNRAERAIEMAEQFLLNPSTLYPWFGSVYPGGWAAAGPGLWLPYGDTGLLQAHAAWSIQNYRDLEARLRLPELLDRRLRIELHGQFLDAPKVAFYGVGTDTTETNKTSYLYRPTTAGVLGTLKAHRHFSVGGGADYFKVETGSGESGVPIDESFTPETAPGLDADPLYIRSNLFAAFDNRTSPGYTDRGGLYRLDWFDYRQQNDGPYSFKRLDGEVRQFIPILHGNWVIGLRGLVSVTDTDDGNQVPYFLLPDLGGANELRGYPSWRFRDRNRILLSGEYRWTPGQLVDMAVFVDAGKVTSRPGDLDLSGLKTSYGIGARFHTPNATVLRVELAHSQEGFGLVVAFHPIF